MATFATMTTSRRELRSDPFACDSASPPLVVEGVAAFPPVTDGKQSDCRRELFADDPAGLQHASVRME
jgi:hypothetical protein